MDFNNDFQSFTVDITSRSSTLAERNGTEEKVGQQSVFHMKGVWWFDSLRSICSACTCCWVSGLIFISFLGFCLPLFYNCTRSNMVCGVMLHWI
ncbi:hypothetical protein I7I53_05216 [Histoplasma capsulatum var. duboisii H88]|uniref:Uncharacterized protein n=1 Tax=Ajellomyces capsulatus (strain H88) TaxID=544711 RepID=A0A8A1LS45_AJEC8|nr:hypothetical protein I7I53_05216 [Histoplasma capsulatum var. duboisii H88]